MEQRKRHYPSVLLMASTLSAADFAALLKSQQNRCVCAFVCVIGDG